MKVKSITVGGFKNVKKSKIEFDGVVALLAVNNYGKSNLLEAIDFGMDFIDSSPKQRKNMMGYSRGIPLTPLLQDDEFFFEIELDEPSLGEYRFVRYGYTFRWYRDDGTGAVITDEWLDARSTEGVRHTAYLKRKKSQIRKSKEVQSFKSIPLEPNRLALDVLYLTEDSDISSVAAFLRTLDYRVCSSLDLRGRFHPVPFEFINDDQEGAVKFDDDDIPRALYNLRKVYPDAYKLFEEAVFTLFPEFRELILTSVSLNYTSVNGIKMRSVPVFVSSDGSVNAEEDASAPPVRLRDVLYRLLLVSDNLNQELSIDNMSAGTKRVIWMLANVFIASRADIAAIGIEEVETSIHPKLLKSLLEILAEAAGSTGIILSSHSPYLVQYLKVSNLYIGVPNDKGVACFKRIKKGKVRQLVTLSRELELSVGEYLLDVMSKERDAAAILGRYLEDDENDRPV